MPKNPMTGRRILYIMAPIEVEYSVEDGHIVVGAATWPHLNLLTPHAELAVLQELVRDTFDKDHSLVSGKLKDQEIINVRENAWPPQTFQMQVVLENGEYVLRAPATKNWCHRHISDCDKDSCKEDCRDKKD